MKNYHKEGLKKALHCNRRIFVKTIIIIFTILVITGSFVFFINQLINMFKKDSEVYLNEIGQRNLNSIIEKINGDVGMLRSMGIILENFDTTDMNYWVAALEDEDLFNRFQSIEILLPNGQAYGQEDVSENFLDREYFKHAMDGQTNISDVLIDDTINVPSIIYATPIYKENKVVAILKTVIYADTYKKILSNSTFGENGHSYIIDHLGNIVLRDDQPESSIETNNIFNGIHNGDKSEVDRMKRNILLQKSGIITSTAADLEKSIVYTPLGMNNWYLITVITDEVTSQKSKAIESMTLILSGFIVFVISVFVIYMIYGHQKYNKAVLKFTYVDELTGVANENYFRLISEELIMRGKSQYALVLLDIDNFKIINNLFGYSLGDDVIKHTATVISDYLRQEEIFARITGDKFHLLIKYTTRDDLKHHVNIIMERISNYKFIDKSYKIVIYAGIYVIENKNMTIDSMSDRAKLAKEKIKKCHMNTCIFYNEDFFNQLLEEKEIEKNMQKALMNKEFKVYIQPQHDLITDEIVSAEALIRWEHPEKGLVYPNSFIPIFEKNGFIIQTDMYVFEEICRYQKQWIEKKNKPLIISVNQSRLHLLNTDYINALITITEKYNINPSLIELEITESVFSNNSINLVEVITKLRKIGFKISIDDFGTGYSSLNMLKDIEVDELKLDREFLNESSNTTRGRKIIASMIKMAKDLNIKTIAEGVETKDQADFLRKVGCDLAQGYYYNRPMEISAFYQLITSHEYI